MILRRTFFILLMSIFLSGCAVPSNPLTGSGSVSRLLHTASGFVVEGSKQAAATIELGKMGVEKAKSAAGDITHRADQLQKGIESVREGKEMIEKAVAK